MSYDHLTDAELIAYLNERHRQRYSHIQATYDKLTAREKLLVVEAAVMGYVQGTRAKAGEPIPPNSVISAEVIGGCLGMPDLYPAMTKVARRAGVR